MGQTLHEPKQLADARLVFSRQLLAHTLPKLLL